ncbi:MAG: type IV pilus modification protein PilV [Betaproteobacteria bacterium]
MKHQNGFSLLEVLIAVVILSFGLLALAGLQLVSLSSNQSAGTRSTATTLAYDMVDRMKANMAGVQAGQYSGIAGSDNACEAVHYDDVHAAPAACTVTELAQDDVYDWKKTVAGLLPSGSGTVCIDSTPSSAACDGAGLSYAVRVSWNDKPKNQSAVTKSVAIGFQP